MICLICKTDVTESEKQFGNVNHPLCQSCWLSNNYWVTESDVIVRELERGASLKDAIEADVKSEISDLEKFAHAFFAEIATSADDAARMQSMQAGTAVV